MVSFLRCRQAGWLAAALCLPAPAWAGLSFDDALQSAQAQAPLLQAQHSALAGAQAVLPAAATLPDPRLTVGLDNLPISGPERWRIGADFMTMQRFGLVQEVPNRAKRDARAAGALARVDRERLLLALAQWAVRRDTALAWLGVWFAQRQAAVLDELDRENRLLLDTLHARIAAGKAQPADFPLAQLEALALADRRDDAQRDVARARAALRRWVGARADEALAGEAPALAVQPDAVRAGVQRQAEIAPFAALRAVALADAREADAESRGDWAWELVYSRRGPAYGDMVSIQLSFDLPWRAAQRQQPQAAAKRSEISRIDAERDDALRRRADEVDTQLADLQALDTQRARLAGPGQALAAERVALTLASYQAGRADLPGVLAARRDAVEARLRLITLDSQRAALQLRLSSLTSVP